jgi:hypothetical protein
MTKVFGAKPVPPTWLRISYSTFVLVLIPIWWRLLGPVNFLWFSDIALFATVISLWKRSPLINSMMFLSVILFESVWTIDVLYELLSGKTLIGLAAYMFDPNEKLIVKILSAIFHIGMPATIIFLLKSWGYDRRAWLRQSLLAALVLLITYLVEPKENINWVRGLAGKEGFTLGLSQNLYLIALMFAYPILAYAPVHFLLCKFVRPAK